MKRVICGSVDGDGLAFGHLFHPQGDHAAATGHHVAVARAADGGLCAFAQLAPFGYGHLLHQGFRHAHGVDGIGGFVGGEHHHVAHFVLDGGEQHVVGAFDVGANGFDGEELARRHLLERGGREHVVHALHGDVHALFVAHVADVILHLWVLQLVAHVVLFLLVAREDAYFLYVAVEETAQHGIAEAARAAGNQ